MCVHHTFAGPAGARKMSDPLELDLQVIVSNPVVLGMGPWPQQKQPVLFPTELGVVIHIHNPNTCEI